MLITYFDEVKPSDPDQPFYWLGGLAIDDQVIPQLDQEINALVVSCFGAGTGLTKKTEFQGRLFPWAVDRRQGDLYRKDEAQDRLQCRSRPLQPAGGHCLAALRQYLPHYGA